MKRCVIVGESDTSETLAARGVHADAIAELERFRRYLAQKVSELTDEELRDRLRYEGIPESRLEEFVARTRRAPA